eukprot:gnl/Hemi2/6893_TR2348_c0_g1_i1.p1 gnl/Hemi2/6893_TR2348_c0_g1~~gnl/Hemi2/6893_TR2348_c0_g1_i1.p1  ORF type:complete len:1011 (+),score=345.74 gnl/Hemi2/6893_TR2348_c0_g1_i1:154-3186(+)
MSAVAEHRFVQLQKNLHALNYVDRLTVECVPLVEKLFADLTRTTTSYQRLESQLKQQAQEVLDWQVQAQPLRKENARVIRENNQLHLEMIRQAEEHDTAMKELQARVKKMQAETEELMFVFKQQEKRLHETESELNSCKKRMELVLPERARGTPQVRAATIEMSSTVSAAKAANGKHHQPEKSRIDILMVYESRMEEANNEVQRLQQEVVANTDTAKAFEAQVQTRELEIARLNKILEAGRDYQKAGMEHINTANQHVIEQLNEQIEFLNSQLSRQEVSALKAQGERATMEQLQIKDLSNKVQTLTAKNNGLLAELRAIRHDLQAKEAAEEDLKKSQKKRETNGPSPFSSPSKPSIKPAASMDHQLVTSLQQQLASANLKLEAVRRDLQDAEAEKQELREATAKILDETRAKYTSTVAILQQQLSGAQQKIDATRADLRDLQNEKQSLERATEQVLEQAGAEHNTQITLLQQQLTNTQAKLDAARLELRASEAEKQELREATSKIMEEVRAKHSSNTTNLQHQLTLVSATHETTKAELDAANAVREDLTAALGKEQKARAKLELELHQAKMKLDDTLQLSPEQAHVQKLEAEVLQLRTVVLTKEREVNERNTELLNLQRRITENEHDELARLRHTLAVTESQLKTLQDDRTDLLNAMEETQTEHMAELERLSRENQTLLQERDSLSGELQNMAHGLHLAEKGGHSLNSELSRLASERQLLLEERAALSGELQAMQEDLQNMTHENQLINSELSLVSSERDKLTKEVSDAMAQWAHSKEMLNVRDRERADFLSRYRKLADEFEAAKRDIRELEMEREQYRQKYYGVEAQVAQARDQSVALSNDNSRLMMDLQAYERQSVNQARVLQQLQRDYDAAVVEKQRLMQDVDAAQSVTFTVEHAREKAQRDLSMFQQEVLGLQASLQQACLEKEAAKGQVEAERHRVRELESLLRDSRKEQAVRQDKHSLQREAAALLSQYQTAARGFGEFQGLLGGNDTTQASSVNTTQQNLTST